VDIDWANARIGFSIAKPPEYPSGDLEFFKAEAAADPEQVQQFLERHPKSRLGKDAAATLATLRVAQKNSSDEQIMNSLQWVADTSPFSNRTLEMIKPFVDQIRESPGRSTDLAIRAAEFALRYSRGAMTIQDAYRLHYSLGEDYLRQNKTRDAWRHLLSAAFQPLEPGLLGGDEGHNVSVNALLGKIYEDRGRIVRAYSRYKQAYQRLELYLEFLDSTSDIEIQKIKDRGGAGWLHWERNVRMLQAIRPVVESGLARLEPQISAEAREMLDAK
jgi:tetratricopeptide (TPR) repeat protein